MGDTDFDKLADHVVNRIIDRMSDEETVQKIVAVWSRQLDQSIGRHVRRTLWVIFIALAVVVSAKINSFTAWFK